MQPPTTVVDMMHDAASREPNLNDPEFNGLNLRALAREMARGIHSIPVIVLRHGLSTRQGALLLQQPNFVKLYRMEKAAWDSSENAGERARQYHREAQAIFAADLAEMVMDRSCPLAARLEAAKLSAKIAFEGQKESAAGGPIGSGFAVNIIFGGDIAPVSIQTTTQKTIESPSE